jgi:hypothetical protein
MIVNDGLMMFKEEMSRQNIARAIQSYVHAVDTGTMIHSRGNHSAPPPPAALADLEEILGSRDINAAPSSSSAKVPAAAAPRLPIPSPIPAPVMDARTKANLAIIRQAALASSLMRVCRRLDYSEEENPNHIMTILVSIGRMVGPVFQCDALVPTIEECADLVTQGVRASKDR